MSRFKSKRAALCFVLAGIACVSNFQTSSELRGLSHPVVDQRAVTNNLSASSSNLSSSFLFSKDDIDFKPTTEISEPKCDPNLAQPLQKIKSFTSYGHNRNNLTSLALIHGNFHTPLAICKFNDQTQVNNFSHVMQQLYACFTFWQDNPSQFPVLYAKGHYDKGKLNRIFSNNAFLKGFIQLLMSQFNVQILTDDEIVNWIRANTDATHSRRVADDVESMNFTYSEIEKFTGYVVSHVDTLSKMTANHTGFDGDRNRDKVHYQLDEIPCFSPTIGILNRNSSYGRSIRNVKSLVREITLELFPNVPSPPVLLEYFEGQTFEQQVRFFESVDLLISPHGAQLTGLPFMANKKCAKVIEVFPHNYFIPDYYGTLAVDSGIEYSTIYLSNNPANGTKGRMAPKSTYERRKAKKKNVCLDPDMTVKMLRDQIRDWCKCRES